MSSTQTKQHAAQEPHPQLVFQRHNRCAGCGSGWWHQAEDSELLTCGSCGKVKQEGDEG